MVKVNCLHGQERFLAEARRSGGRVSRRCAERAEGGADFVLHLLMIRVVSKGKRERKTPAESWNFSRRKRGIRRKENIVLGKRSSVMNDMSYSSIVRSSWGMLVRLFFWRISFARLR